MQRNAQKLDMTNELFAICFLYKQLDSSPIHLENVLLVCDLNTRFSVVSNQQDAAMFVLLILFKRAVHVSGDSEVK